MIRYCPIHILHLPFLVISNDENHVTILGRSYSWQFVLITKSIHKHINPHKIRGFHRTVYSVLCCANVQSYHWVMMVPREVLSPFSQL